jgi:transcription-repair coupling factor (superfamily II helicase)
LSGTETHRAASAGELIRGILEAGAAEGVSSRTGGLLIAYLLHVHTGRLVCWIGPDNEAAEAAARELTYFLGAAEQSLLIFPGLEVSPYRGLSPHPDVASRRAVALAQLAKGFSGMLVTTGDAAVTRTVAPDEFGARCRELFMGEALERDELIQELRSRGYVREEPVSGPGEFSFRGGIVDVFSPHENWPARVEFFGDRIESLRLFDPETQRTVRLTPAYRIVPMRELTPRPEEVRLWHEEAPRRWGEVRFAERLQEIFQFTGHGELFNGFEFLLPLVLPLRGTLFDYLTGGEEAPVILLEEPEDLLRRANSLWEEESGNFEESNRAGEPALPPETFFLHPDKLREALSGMGTVISLERISTSSKPSVALDLRPNLSYRGRFQEFLKDLEEGREEGMVQVLVMRSKGMRDRILEILAEYDLGWGVPCESFQESLSHGLSATVGNVESGFSSRRLGLRLITEDEIFGPREQRRTPVPKRESWEAFRSDLRDLQEGDYVVHVEHGIGRFCGLQSVGVGEKQGEFLAIEYADGGKLYVPVDRLDLVHKYSSAGAPPRVDRLGGSSWNKTKDRIKKSMRDLAEDLLQLYAKRQIAEGHAFPPDDEFMAEFEAAFDYDPTPDQEAAIEACKRDMESVRPMDRLICGDVGYGKTEVAMRAAFKAVSDSKQVAVLAPTTVLAFQHFRTFRERLAGFPVRIEMLSRFLNPKEQREVVQQVREGTVDILVGTHRLLSRDVAFKDLGLVIVDEEQRFGVAQKEKLKKLKTHVDVLTLTATPIPRTLNMSLAGIRDLSVIETPPKDRLAIHTVVTRFSPKIVRSAVDLELKRQGQVFFVHNSVETIYSMASTLRQIVPDARIGVAHGQMEEDELEKVMLGFLNYRYDVLLCTTIIENGLDIPRANTIIVNRADRFGLSQLYQLRGRVGRSNRRAYAYLLIPDEDSLTPDARKRLAAVREFSELGSGFRLAAMDLEIRGAGNLLGGEQSGHINAVGFELYMRLLEEAVRELKGERPAQEERPSLELRLNLRIPEHYIDEPAARIWLYKRIGAVRDQDSWERLRAEIIDRFGPLPRPVEHLLTAARLRLRAESLGVRSIVRKGTLVIIRFHETTPIRIESAVQVVKESRDLSFSPDGDLLWSPPVGAGDGDILDGLFSVFERLEYAS